MRLPLVYIGDPVLRQKAAEITTITSEIKQLAKDMLETMHATNGIGLAAPQVGQSLRLFVLLVIEEDAKGRVKTEKERVYINPKIEEVSQEVVGMTEGCLSIPGIYVDEVIRPKTIKVTALDLDGNITTEEITGWHARVVLHENDHLNGVLFIDRLTPKQKKIIEDDLKKVKKKYEVPSC
jgi:peptide deformylase